MNGLGPFEVNPETVERLGAAFSLFVNELLVRESARAGLLGYQVRVDSQDNTPDGGVDAALDASVATTWIAQGKSAWQFKRNDRAPAKCAEEIAQARWAHELLRNGATYTLVLGRRLGDQKIETRRAKLVAKAQELGLVGDDDGRIQVIDANALARWATEFPALAISTLLGAPGRGVIDYATWSASNRHEFKWVQTEDRNNGINTIRSTVNTGVFAEMHVTGDSGIGKTRLVMEAMRPDELQPLVVYVQDHASLNRDVLGYLLREGRTAILVVDECSRRSHEKLAELIPSGSTLRLITIGEPDSYSLRAPTLAVSTMEEAGVETFLKENYGQLSVEARRFVSEQSLGNIRFAVVLAERVLTEQGAQAAALISRSDLEQLVHALLPDGRPFFLSTLFALFERVGWDRELRPQLEAVATFASATIQELEDVGRDLETRGLLARQGRYRLIAPHPVAVVLAADAWQREGDRIVDELLPAIGREMAMSLFSRVADLGRYEPARSVLRGLMSAEGPFGSLDSIEQDALGGFLTQLAIVAPDETIRHLADLIEAEPLEALAGATKSRRDLVWTLEKLAWHRHTFERAADALLRLARAENESYGNNATGTWLSLFGAALPATAATPDVRLSYLRSRAQSDSGDVRALVVQACTQGLDTHESVMVSAEIQGGVLVEPRGGVETYTEASDYRGALVDILAGLTADPTEKVRNATVDALVGSMFSLLRDSLVREKLIRALTGLPEAALPQVRQEVERLRRMLRDRDEAEAATVLDDLTAKLPPVGPAEELKTLLALQPWHLDEDELRERVHTLVATLLKSGRLDDVLSWLDEEAMPSAWLLGNVLAAHRSADDHILDRLVTAAELNLAALGGYLSRMVELGQKNAFDEFLDSDRGSKLSPRHSLLLTVRGPTTKRARRRAFEFLASLPVDEGSYALFGWQRELSAADLRRLLPFWLPRIDSQRSYNAVIDWLALWGHAHKRLPEAVHASVFNLLKARRTFNDLANQRWDWNLLARLFVRPHALELATLVLDLVSERELILLPSDEEAQLLREAATTAPHEVWQEVAARLENKDWRVSMMLRGWFTDALPVEIIREWIGDSGDRARLVAEIAPAGSGGPTDLARFLLTAFADNEAISGALAADYVSGGWVGPESDQLATQIAQLEGWRSNGKEPDAVRRWASNLIDSLERRRQHALEREAERRW